MILVNFGESEFINSEITYKVTYVGRLIFFFCLFWKILKGQQYFEGVEVEDGASGEIIGPKDGQSVAPQTF